MQAMDSEVQRRVAELRGQIAELENATAPVLRTRLARAHPFHIARITRGLFLGLTLTAAVLMIGSLLLPLVMPDVARLLGDIDRSLPVPVPVLTVMLTLCMALGWVTAGQASQAIGRDCPMLPWELEQRRRLESELSLLGSAQSTMISAQPDDGPPPLYMPQSRLSSENQAPMAGFPAPVSTPGGTLQYESAGDPFSGARDRGTPIGTGLFGGTPRPASGTPRPARGGNPRPVGSYGTPAGAAPRAASSSLSYRGPEPGLAPEPPPADPGSGGGGFRRSALDGYTIGPETASDPASGSGPAASWRTPQFSPTDEPWLQDALQKAETLTRRYPVQAFLEYSAEADLPFTLVLERATPAMAIRAMVDYVGFLASIATPRRARIELRSVVHLDRSFYRSVMSAMEPYFPDTVDIKQQGYRVEITFLEPDRNWGRYPVLPLD